MTYSKSSSCVRTASTTLAAALCLCVLGYTASPADAAGGSASFTVRISESEKYLVNNTMTPQFGVDSMYFRNTPFLEVKNTSQAASLTEFRMTIGDEIFHFGNNLYPDFVLLGSLPGSIPAGGLQLDASVASAGNELVVNFLDGGLAPGELVRFRFDIDFDANPTMGAPDYRNVLFDRGGHQQYGTSPEGISSSDNAKVTAKFSMTGMAPFSSGPFAFPDTSTAGGPFTDGIIFAPYIQSVSADPPAAFSLDTGAVVPEPASVFLLLLGLSAIAALHVRCDGRRRALAAVAVIGARRG